MHSELSNLSLFAQMLFKVAWMTGLGPGILIAIVFDVEEAKRLLEAASHALRSYQYGNAATELAEEMVEAIERFLETGEPQTLVGKAKR